MDKPNTRDILLGAMAACLQEHGYRSTSTTQILAETGVSRGSLYFHFPDGKQALAAAAVQVAGKHVSSWINTEFAAAPNAATAAGRLIESFAKTLYDSQFTKGCPVALCALEAGEQEPDLQLAVRSAYADWQDSIRAGLMSHGIGPRAALQFAQLALLQIEGALLMARATRSLAPLKLAKSSIVELVGGYS
jgi:TetR/AcrR family transcriptional repressor of lmrAB and yxaGH operons